MPRLSALWLWMIVGGVLTTLQGACNPLPGTVTPTQTPARTAAPTPPSTPTLQATPPSGQTATATPTPDPTHTPIATATPTPAGTQVQNVTLEPVVTGLTSPVGMAFPADGSHRKFVIDQVGVIHLLDANNTLVPNVFLDIRDRLVALDPNYDERGLLGLAFHPAYAQNGRFFVYYDAPKGPDAPADFDSEIRLSEFRVSAGDPNRADPTGERILLRLDDPQFNHNAGQLAFGPDDGYLYVGIGDGGGANDVGVGHDPLIGNGQDRSVLFGKVLRVDVNGAGGLAIPPDNPFVAVTGDRGEIWAYGLRNPWRFSFDMGGSHRLFLADVGQDLFEEIDLVEKGGNYGWRIREGPACFDPNSPGSPPASCPTVGAHGEPLIAPILTYPHQDPAGGVAGIAVIGGFVYRGSQLPGLIGQYVFGDWSRPSAPADGTLLAGEEAMDGTWSMRELQIAGSANNRISAYILGFGQDSSGEIYVLTTQNAGPSGATGAVYQMAPAP